MGQFNFFDLSRRYEGLDRNRDPLVLMATLIPCENFRPKLKRALQAVELRSNPGERKSTAGRKLWDEVVIFKAMILQSLYSFSNEQTEYARD